MKEGWIYKKLKEIGRTQTGTTPSKSVKTYYGGEIPFIRPAELDIDGNGSIEYNSELKLTQEGALKSRMISANSILMCCIGSVGKTGYSIKDVTCNQQINTITPYEGYNSKFVYYALLTPSFQNEVIKIANSAKATLAIISKGKWEEMSIPVPPLSEQQSIVDYLDSAFAKIDAMKANAEKALNEAKALFQASLKEMLEPKEGWEEKELKDIVDTNCPISYGIVQQGNHVEGGIPVVRPVDLNKKYITADNLKCTTKSISSSYKRTILRGDEILLGVRGTTGIVGIATEELNGCNVNRGIVPLFFKDIICRDFIYYEMLSPAMQSIFAEETTGSTLKQINIKDLRRILFYYPHIEVQQSIVATLDSLKSKVDRLQENFDKISQECDALKQAILRQVFE